MASFLEAPMIWWNGHKTKARCVENNAAWLCSCGEAVLGPHEGMYPINPCPVCDKSVRVIRGEKPQYVDRVEEYLTTVLLK